jgi:hypothetical protein
MAQAHKVDDIQVNLKLSELDTAGKVALASLIAGSAPKSDIYADNPFVKDAADKVIKCGADLEAATKEADSAEMKANSAKAAVAVNEARFDKAALCFKTAAEASCTTEVELNDLGFNRRPPKAAPLALTAPTAIVTRMGKEKGTMVVQAKRVGRIATYLAEISPDPIGPGSWQQIPGTGTRRTLSGYQSGAHYWVRFRTVRANEESAWSEPAMAIAR